MGGVGSGNWYRSARKTTLDQVNRIDIRYMKKQNILKPGSNGNFNWARNGKPNGSIKYRCHDYFLQLNFSYRQLGHEWQTVEQRISFDRTPCHYGGERLWFLCPNCNKRVGILCCDDSKFLCRHCHRLPYASQHQQRLTRLISQKHKLGEHIFASYAHGDGLGKKKGMHWRTFSRLHARYQTIEQDWQQHMTAYLDLL